MKYKYEGSFEYFCEMGGGPSLMFKDVKIKYLRGYSELDMCYFFKYDDSFLINGRKCRITIHPDSPEFILVPDDVELMKNWDELLTNKEIVTLESKKKLYNNLIIVDLSMKDNEIEENLNRILKEDNLLKRQKAIKKELNYYLKENNSVLDYVRKKEFYGLSAYEIFLNNGTIISK